jgi:hypothetical protein
MFLAQKVFFFLQQSVIIMVSTVAQHGCGNLVLDIFWPISTWIIQQIGGYIKVMNVIYVLPTGGFELTQIWRGELKWQINLEA